MSHLLDRDALALAIDVGGTKVEAALVDASGALIPGSRQRRPTGPSASSEALHAAVFDAIDHAVAGLPQGATIAGVGIGSAGPIVAAEGLVSPLNMPAWRRYPLRDLVSDHLGLPTRLQMDGLCITLAEHWVGAAQGRQNVMGMIVSTGVGGGLILGGRAIVGGSGNAGHIGHIEVGGSDVRCKCGGLGCVEAIAAGPRSVEWANAHGWQGTTGEDLARGYADGHPVAIDAVRRAGHALGHAIASAASLADLDIVAIGGGFSHVTPDLFGFIRESVAERRSFEFVTRVEIVPSRLSGDGPLIGAACLVHRPELLGGR